MDTVITVTLYASADTAEPIFEECRAILKELESIWSRHDSKSEISAFNEAEISLQLDARTAEMIATALDVSAKTDGAFDITVAPLVELWQGAEEADQLPEQAQMNAVLQAVGFEALHLQGQSLSKTQKEVKIDLGGIGKGAAISRLIFYLESCNVTGGLVSFGSNVAVFGQKPKNEPYRIALRNPKSENGYAGALTMQAGEVLSVSGDYERYYTVEGEQYHHILDPQTGYPADTGLCSVAIICQDGALADALSTALFVMGEARAAELYKSGAYDFEAIFITTSGDVHTTDGLRERFQPMK